MRPLVADASALLKPALAEAGAVEVRQRVLDRVRAGEPILVPMFFWLEVVNALTRRHGFTGAAVMEAIHELDQFGVEGQELGQADVLQVLDLVERHALSAWDAGYLALAVATDAELLTVDRDLARAAGARAIYIDEAGRVAEPPAPHEAPPTWPTWRGAAAYLGELRRAARA